MFRFIDICSAGGTHSVVCLVVAFAAHLGIMVNILIAMPLETLAVDYQPLVIDQKP